MSLQNAIHINSSTLIINMFRKIKAFSKKKRKKERKRTKMGLTFVALTKLFCIHYIFKLMMCELEDFKHNFNQLADYDWRQGKVSEMKYGPKLYLR